jgi:hypothetical protein
LLSDRGEVIGITTGSWASGQSLNLAVPVYKLVGLLRRRNPLQALEALAEAGRLPGEQWTLWEKQNLTFFFCAIKGEQDARQEFLRKRDMSQQAELAFCYRVVGNSMVYAKRVDADVLRKVHPELAAAYRQKFLYFLEAAERRVVSHARIPQQAVSAMNAWWDWWNANKSDLQFPDEVPVLREFGLTDEWTRQWPGVRFPRFVPQ